MIYRVFWLDRSGVYHHAHYRQSGEGWMVGPCGAIAHAPWRRAMEGSEWQAKRIGRRPCGRCLPDRRT